MAAAEPIAAVHPEHSETLRLVVPGGLGYSSGGTVYNKALLTELHRLGVPARETTVSGEWPVGSTADRARLARALDPKGSGEAAPESILVDGLIALGAPDEVRAGAHACAESGTVLGILVHMLLTDAPGLAPARRARLAGLERDALEAAPAVVVPSEFAARRLAQRYGTRADVASPGVVRVPAAGGSIAEGKPPHLLCLAALLPGKGQLRLVRSLGALRGEPWTLTLAGHDDADPAYARRLAAEAERLGIADRVDLPGELRGPALAAEWERTDLTVLASESETFGLSVAESLARGVPAIVGAGTGATEALALSLAGGLGPAGTAAEPAPAGSDEPAADPLTAELAQWLGLGGVRARWRAAARAARPLLPGWEATARAVVRAMRPGG
ncbi:glycosyl transferase [Sinomonas cellulolyticus]|uniref:Glycosyltransferase family 4 protein n=1 Tax=Sinomonas cellulolyticus TaxID=2801916 RepID=A0ABS1K651_9MICC|nr:MULTISPECIES: glycosyltransferase family 4 protein [Sinomonas]MBL0706975.1 glycosyltransferase family 4 protein [Sinomonas cellulolyticus]GHG59508.1 glycosyl transferase [Sinomonas sp. KCTC 49339]